MDTAWAVVIVAALGIVVPVVDRALDRRHTRAMAKAERDHARLLTLYYEVGGALETWRLYVQRTHPVFGPLPPPPDGPSDDELTKLEAQLAIGGSTAAGQRVRETSAALRKFEVAAGQYQSLREHNENWTDAWQAMDAARILVYEAINRAEATMHEEVTV